MEIKKVLSRKDGDREVKFLIVPLHSDIQKGDYVRIEKIDLEEAKNDKSR